MPTQIQKYINRLKNPFRRNKYKKLKNLSQESIFDPFEEWKNKQLDSDPLPKRSETYRQYVNPDFQSGSGRRRKRYLKHRKAKKPKKIMKRKRYSRRLRKKR